MHGAVDGFLVVVPFGSMWAEPGLHREAGHARMPSEETIRLWEVCEHGCMAMLGMWALLLTSSGRVGSAEWEPLSLMASVWVQPWGDSLGGFRPGHRFPNWRDYCQ